MSIHRNHDNPDRRGIAMMMVLLAVAMAAVLATAYLVSRDNSITIARNSAAAGQARWVAKSGLDTAVAVLQTKTDWRFNHTAGNLLAEYSIAGGDLTVSARDLETGMVPGPSTEYLRLTAVATVDVEGDGRADGRQEAEYLAYVPKVTRDRVAIDLAEFAVFARSSLHLRDNATIARWPTAPLSKLGRRIALGTHAIASDSIHVADNAACIDCTVYHNDQASGTLIYNDSGPPIGQVPMPFDMPFPLPMPPGVADPPLSAAELNLTSNTMTINADDRYDHLALAASSQLTLQGDITFVVEDDMELREGSQILIDGNVTIVVFDNLLLETMSSIELEPASTLTLFVGNGMTLSDSYIGELRPDDDDTRDHTGSAPHMDPWRIQVYTIEAVATSPVWQLSLNSVIKGSLYGYTASLEVRDTSALYGRVGADTVMVRDDSAIFYDHSLDERVGYTNSQSLLFSGANMNSAYLTTSLDPAVLVAGATATDTVIHAGGGYYEPLGPPPSDPPVGPGDPTPRPVPVEHLISSFGAKTTYMEHPDTVNGSSAGGSDLSL